MAEVLTEGGASAALAASIFHFGEVRLPEARAELRAAGSGGAAVIPVPEPVFDERGLVPVVVQDRAQRRRAHGGVGQP